MATIPYVNDPAAVVARPKAGGRYLTEVSIRDRSIVADEPVSVGGEGAGPTPFEMLSAALATCTSMTLSLYAEKKGITLPPYRVEVAHSIVPADRGGRVDRFDRVIVLEGPADAEMQAKILEVSEKCPVHRTLMRGFEIGTRFGSATEPAAHAHGEPAETHEKEMEKACR